MNDTPYIPEQPFIPRLRAAIGCPIKWDLIHPSHPGLCKDLRLFWVELANDFETDCEMYYYSRFHGAVCPLGESEMARIEINTALWRPRAIAEYESRAGYLAKLRFANATEYGKHFPPPALSEAQIIERTRTSDSLFFPEVLPHLDRILISAIAFDLRYIIENRPNCIFAEAFLPVGASEGMATNILRLDLNYAHPLAHGHPRVQIPPSSRLIRFSNREYTNFPPETYREFRNDIDEPLEPGL